MAYHPHTADEIAEMLTVIGVKSLDDLFTTIPAHHRETAVPEIAEALSEQDLIGHLNSLAQSNAQPNEWSSFLGSGANRHYIPAAVNALASRQEFLTAYTPYQAEVSQGTLQAIFEFQTLVCQLLGMEVANASLYDGASATAEAVLMAKRIAKKRPDTLLAESVHPHYRETVRTYTKYVDGNISDVPFNKNFGTIDVEALKNSLNDSVGAVVIQQPNFFGCVEDLEELINIIHEAGALAIVTTTEPLTFGILRPPGDYGADIVCGEGQSFGNPVSFGGPYLGLLATRDKFVRRMPGRLIGETVDDRGQRAFCMTLATREQHIRREKATSNICTNEGLCALMATIHMSMLGKNGIKELAQLNLSRAEYAKRKIKDASGMSLGFTAPTFNEFVIDLTNDAKEITAALQKQNIIPGFALGDWYPGMDNKLLVSVTELNDRDSIDKWADALGSAK